MAILITQMSSPIYASVRWSLCIHPENSITLTCKLFPFPSRLPSARLFPPQKPSLWFPQPPSEIVLLSCISNSTSVHLYLASRKCVFWTQKRLESRLGLPPPPSTDGFWLVDGFSFLAGKCFLHTARGCGAWLKDGGRTKHRHGKSKEIGECKEEEETYMGCQDGWAMRYAERSVKDRRDTSSIRTYTVRIWNPQTSTRKMFKPRTPTKLSKNLIVGDLPFHPSTIPPPQKKRVK